MPNTCPRFFAIFVLSLAPVFQGCQGYAYTVNEQAVYTPKPLFHDFSLADKNLFECVKQTIADQQVRKAEQLQQLNCSHAGIRTLKGLDVFLALAQVDLRGNPVEDISALRQLNNLDTVFLDDSAQLDCVAVNELKERNVNIVGEFACY